MFDDEASTNTALLYGGSVKPTNIASLMSQIDINGALVGRASLHVDSKVELVRLAAHNAS
ncbi:MAG: triose-phosphate isomerase [Chloroflexi bacterium]|nr:triose-phosphate isomerase [Chloroflexota bacterium]